MIELYGPGMFALGAAAGICAGSLMFQPSVTRWKAVARAFQDKAASHLADNEQLLSENWKLRDKLAGYSRQRSEAGKAAAAATNRKRAAKRAEAKAATMAAFNPAVMRTRAQVVAPVKAARTRKKSGGDGVAPQSGG